MAQRTMLLDALPNPVFNAENSMELLCAAKRVLVIGCSGSGKSTLAKRVSKSVDLAYFSMDRDVFWLPGWKRRDRQSQSDILSNIVAGDRWILDSTGKTSFDIGLPRTEIVVWLTRRRQVNKLIDQLMQNALETRHAEV